MWKTRYETIISELKKRINFVVSVGYPVENSGRRRGIKGEREQAQEGGEMRLSGCRDGSI